MSELRYGPVHPRHRPLGQPHAGRPRTDTCKDRREHIFALSRSAVFAGVVQQSQRQGPGSAAAQARQSLGHSGSQAGHAHDRHRRGVGDHPRAGRAPRRAHPRHSPHLCDETRSLNDQNRFISLLYNDKYTCHQPYTVAHFAIRKRIVSEFTPYSDVACPPLSVRIRSCHGAGLILRRMELSKSFSAWCFDGDRNAIVALGHDPTLLGIARAATSGSPAFLPADRLLRFIQHPRSCPPNRLMDTKPATINNQSLSQIPPNPTGGPRRRQTSARPSAPTLGGRTPDQSRRLGRCPRRRLPQRAVRLLPPSCRRRCA